LTFTKNFKEVRKHQGISFRNSARSFALDLLSFKNELFNVEKAFQRPRVQFLFIHHIFEDELHTFETLLKKLSEHHTFISHTEAVDRILSGTVDKAYISWSSDDGFKNNLEAAKILNSFNAPACFFINPDSIGQEDEQWISKFCKDRLNMPPVAFLNWKEVEQLQKWGHEIGSHTMNHRNISQMSLQEVEDDLNISKRHLEQYCGTTNHFAYPYGLFEDINKDAFDLVFKAGYNSCSTGERGCHISDGNNLKNNQLLLRRDQVICAWPLQHIMYFVANASKKASVASNYYPT